MCDDAHVIAVIGSGGKTTLIETLARQLRRRHPDSVVAISTTTRQWPPSRLPLIANQTAGEAMSQLARLGVAYVADTCPARGASATSGSDATDPTTAISQQDQTASNTSAVKLCEPSWGIDRLAADVVASGGYLLIEADGSRGLPLKAHADWEPVVPPSTQRCILVVGASGFGRPVRAAAHRPELFCSRAGCSLESAASPERVADEIAIEITCGAVHFDVTFVNQVDFGQDVASLAPQALQPHLTPAQPRHTQTLPHSAQAQPCLTPAQPHATQAQSRPAQVQPRSAQTQSRPTLTEVLAFASELRKRGISVPIWFGSARAGLAALTTVG
ncbi:MAG: selenium cofactor biosynthesis protein YqeC [Atopobiaceae bacterium]